MRIWDIRVDETADGRSELSANVEVLKPRPETYRIWFRGPRGCFGNAPTGDIYFAAFWIPAMFLQESFVIEGEVSKELLDAAYGRLEPVLLRWYRDELVHTPLEGARIVETPTPPSEGRGCLFSGGLDSSYSVAKNLDSLTHLIFIQGFDMLWHSNEAAETALRSLRQTASELNLEFLVIHSNLQEPIIHLSMRSGELGRSRPAFLMEFYFGSMLATYGLCLRGILGHMTIASSWSYEHLSPKGSHPLIERNWSTSTMGFHLDGCEADRFEKASFLVGHQPGMLRHLRVCMRPGSEGAVNCGNCLKCVKTMIELRLAGAGEEAFSNFELPFDLKRAKMVSFKRNTGLGDDFLNQVRQTGDRELIRTAEIILNKRFYWPKFWRDFNERRRERRRAKRRGGTPGRS